MTGIAIAFDRVTAGYAHQPVLQDFSAAFAAGSLTAIAGPNGAGKSTLMKLAAGMLRPRAGTVTAPRTLSYLPQLATIQRDFPLTALDAVCTGFYRSRGLSHPLTDADRARARMAMHEVGLHRCENRLLDELSGGQFQRLLFARVLIEDAPTILLDEPFAAVDAATTRTLLQLIAGWHREGRTVLCVLHDLALVRRHFPDTLLLTDTRGVSHHGPTAALATRGLLSSDEAA